ncbi:response regulator [Sulfurospirillum arcachonense]|uniref:response regulator n=1 Tax=Sulfurospirillum arcachonense TaxID=57666 RepID=UPI0004B678BA|nr:response regulator [Sulfurospirillum arcachonense]
MRKISNLCRNNTLILIVEDQISIANKMKDTLIEYGYKVTGIETSADAAVEHASQNRPDIILMDIKLEGRKTGVDAAKKIWNYYKIPIVFVTSCSDSKTIKSAMLSEPYGYLIKPIKNDELKVTIDIALYKHNYFFKNTDVIEKTFVEKQLMFIDGFSFNRAKKILYKDNIPIKLTGNETKLFDILTQTPGEPISFEQISNFIWRENYYDVGKLRTLVYRIKTKLKTNLIENIYELGYKVKVN